MAIVNNTYTGDGTTTLYSISFPYIQESDVKARIDGVLTTDFTFSNSNTIEFDVAPANASTILISRNTNVDELNSVFFSGSSVKARDLNENFSQQLYVVQEADFNTELAEVNSLTALSQSTQALSDSASATTTANTADTNASTALTNSSAAVSTANSASSDAAAAVAAANAAQAINNSFTLTATDITADKPIKASNGVLLPFETGNTFAENGAIRYNDSIDKIELYDGSQSAWKTAAGGSFVGSSPPPNPFSGDLWWQPVLGKCYVYYTDADSSQWVELNPSWTGGIADDEVTTAKIADANVTTAKILDANVTTAKIADDAVTLPKLANDLTDKLGHRNLIINGDISIAQRGNSLSSPTNGSFLVDRWINYTTKTNITIEQSTASGLAGFNSSLKWTITGTGAALPADGYVIISQKIEGSNSYQLNYGTADAKPVTISFWVKSSVTGNYTVTVRNDVSNDPATSYNTQYNIPNTGWNYITLTVPGPTSGTWNNVSTSTGLEVMWGIDVGTDFHTTADSWLTSPLKFGLATAANNWTDTSNNTFEITGVQVEMGSTATPFEHRNLADELSRCQRYYQENMVNIQTQSGSVLVTHSLVPEMRTTPSQTLLVAGTVISGTIANSFGNPTPRSYFYQMSGVTGGGYTVGRIYSYTAEL